MNDKLSFVNSYSFNIFIYNRRWPAFTLNAIAVGSIIPQKIKFRVLLLEMMRNSQKQKKMTTCFWKATSASQKLVKTTPQETNTPTTHIILQNRPLRWASFAKTSRIFYLLVQTHVCSFFRKDFAWKAKDVRSNIYVGDRRKH